MNFVIGGQGIDGDLLFTYSRNIYNMDSFTVAGSLCKGKFSLESEN